MKSKKYNFAEWVKKFRDAGFFVEVKPHLKHDENFSDLSEVAYWEAWVSRKGIEGVFGCDKAPNKYIQSRFAADHENCFDKVSKCPLVVKLPCDFDELLKHLEFLGSEDGFEISNNYEYEHNNPFPYQV